MVAPGCVIGFQECTVGFQECMVCLHNMYSVFPEMYGLFTRYSCMYSGFPVWWVYNIMYRLEFPEMNGFPRCVQCISRNTWCISKICKVISRNVWWVYKIHTYSMYREMYGGFTRYLTWVNSYSQK